MMSCPYCTLTGTHVHPTPTGVYFWVTLHATGANVPVADPVNPAPAEPAVKPITEGAEDFEAWEDQLGWRS